jgi:hypothetical protein
VRAARTVDVQVPARVGGTPAALGGLLRLRDPLAEIDRLSALASTSRRGRLMVERDVRISATTYEP